MKRTGLLILAALALVSCDRKREPNKILDGFTAGSFEVVIPANAAQQYFLLKRDLLRVLIPVLTRLANEGPIGGITGPGAGQTYTFQSTESHYGTANFTLTFRDDTGAVIDPIAVRGSSTTLKSVDIAGAAASTEFPTISETLTLVLESSGVVTSVARLSGTSAFAGPSYSLNFQIAAPGSKAIFEALTDGSASATGTGGTPPAPATLALSFGSERDANGTLTWEGREGGIHLELNGSGFVVEPEGRILLQ